MNRRTAILALALATLMALTGVAQVSAHSNRHHHRTAKVWINKAACAGEAAATVGSWSVAQQEYLLAQETTKNLGASTVFASLGFDTGAVALDQLGGTIPALAAHDAVTYRSDLKKGKQWFKACRP